MQCNKTYGDDGAAEHQVPQQVLLPGELWVCRLKLVGILVHEVCVEDYAQLWTGKEEAGDKSPYLGRDLEDLQVVEVEPGIGKDAHVTTNRSDQDGSRKGPAKAGIRFGPSSREVESLLTLLCLARASKHP